MATIEDLFDIEKGEAAAEEDSVIAPALHEDTKSIS